MNWTQDDAFRAGFLYEAARSGVRHDQADAMAKYAVGADMTTGSLSVLGSILSNLFRGATNLGGRAMTATSNVLSRASGPAMYMAAGVPIIGGGALGYALGRSETSPDDVTDYQKEILVRSFKAMAEDQKRRKRLETRRHKNLSFGRASV